MQRSRQKNQQFGKEAMKARLTRNSLINQKHHIHCSDKITDETAKQIILIHWFKYNINWVPELTRTWVSL